MITVPLKEAYSLIYKKEVKQLNGNQKTKLLKTIEENFGEYQITGKGKATRIIFNYEQDKCIDIKKKKRNERIVNEEKILHFLCGNYETIDFITNTEIANAIGCCRNTVETIIKELRKSGYLEPKLEKEETQFVNRIGEIDTYLKDVNKNTYFFKYNDGNCIKIDRKLYALYFQWRNEWQHKYYEEQPLSKKAIEGSYHAFLRLHKFIPMKKHTKKPKDEVMKMLGYEIPINSLKFIKEREYEPIEDAFFDDLCKQDDMNISECSFEKVNEIIEEFQLPKTKVIKIKVIDKTKPREGIFTIKKENKQKGFGKIAKFESVILPNGELQNII